MAKKAASLSPPAVCAIPMRRRSADGDTRPGLSPTGASPGAGPMKVHSPLAIRQRPGAGNCRLGLPVKIVGATRAAHSGDVTRQSISAVPRAAISAMD